MNVPPGENAQEEPFYESSNGDVWSLTADSQSGEPVVIHRPNANSGGQVSHVDVDIFLEESPAGPQHQALRNFLGLDY
jgi:hypothetical protein